MKLTNQLLKKIIKEELEAVMEGDIEADYQFYKKREKEQRPKKVKENAIKRAVDRFNSIIDKEYGLDTFAVDKMIYKNKGIEFEGNDYYRVKDLAEAIVEKEVKSTDIERLKFSDDKIIGPAVGVEMFKLIRPIIKKNRGFFDKTLNHLKGRSFKQ